ncbi:PREDICTED: contactin-5-like [Amphimedon queenslandica]|uniref:Uncharacterized protein n=1 Tax=Amphimedon queenslandica TaxID=400682 RepID=A0A1X7VS55_AMPQE|nr:PREDICTED: contactin-5-like [Amphimedon queenslandica]|eukprot:XP_011406589.2 PREDICTED: contactin-5-like [Amphimedon queenslandica]
MKPVNLFSLSLPFITFLIASYHQVSSQSLPNITIRPSDDTALHSSSNIRLDCTANTTSNVSYQWLRNGNIVLPTSKISILPNNSLLISGFESVHNGNYSCNVTNGNWTLISHSVLVSLAYVTSSQNGQTVQKNVTRNNYTILPCLPSYTGYPLHELSPLWHVYDLANYPMYVLFVGSVNSENSAIVGGNGDLYLRKVITPLKYECRLTNSITQSYQYHATTINVVGSIAELAPTPLAVPTDVTVAKGDRTSMNCIASGSLSVVNMTGPDGAVISKGIQSINSADSSDEGSYSCDITGTPGTYTGTLTIKHAPSITVHPPSSVDITYGSSLTLSCTATGSDISWVWYHNGIKISDSSTLVVSTTGLEDSGAYQCFATNEAGVDSKSTLVTVKTVPPSFTNNGRLSNTLGFARENLTLRCNATGAPAPFYEWKKEETSISESNSDFSLSSPGVLVFKSLNSALQGNYTCIAKSMIDPQTVVGMVSSTAQVYVAEPTVITSVHKPSIIIYKGESFVLNCSVSHDTSKTNIALHWTLNGTIIPNNTHTRLMRSADQSELSLRVMAAGSNDLGHYQCQALTSYINTPFLTAPVVYSERTSIIVTNFPVKPSVTNVSSSYPTVLEVKWIYDGYDYNVESYRIEIQNSTSDAWYPSKPNTAISATSTTRAYIVELEPYSYYSVRVVAILTDGREVASDPYGPVRTAQAVPGLPPQRLRAVSRSKTDITLFWEPPAVTARYGVITDYTVSYWVSSTGASPPQSSSIINQTIGSNATTHVLSRLAGGNTYWIRIAAHNTAGMGPFSSTINATTDSNIGGTSDSDDPIHRKTWFIFLLCFVGLILIILGVACIATARWNSNRKGHKYPVGSSFRGEEVVDFSRDVVNDYEKRRKPLEPINSVFSDDETRESESSQATLPQSMTHAMYGPSTDSVIRRGIPLHVPPLPGYAMPPSYINPPSFEDSMKQRLNKRRSASMSFLERAEHFNLGGSGWSVGHDPKAGFLMYEDVDTDSVDKTHLHHIQDDISGGSSDSRLQSNPLATRSGSLATFV